MSTEFVSLRFCLLFILWSQSAANLFVSGSFRSVPSLRPVLFPSDSGMYHLPNIEKEPPIEKRNLNHRENNSIPPGRIFKDQRDSPPRGINARQIGVEESPAISRQYFIKVQSPSGSVEVPQKGQQQFQEEVARRENRQVPKYLSKPRDITSSSRKKINSRKDFLPSGQEGGEETMEDGASSVFRNAPGSLSSLLLMDKSFLDVLGPVLQQQQQQKREDDGGEEDREDASSSSSHRRPGMVESGFLPSNPPPTRRRQDLNERTQRRHFGEERKFLNEQDEKSSPSSRPGPPYILPSREAQQERQRDEEEESESKQRQGDGHGAGYEENDEEEEEEEDGEDAHPQGSHENNRNTRQHPEPDSEERDEDDEREEEESSHRENHPQDDDDDEEGPGGGGGDSNYPDESSIDDERDKMMEYKPYKDPRVYLEDNKHRTEKGKQNEQK